MNSLAAVLAALLVLPAAARGQNALHVLDHAPRAVARPTDVITITFDRPVAGSLDHSVDPSSVVHIAPAVQMRVEWRDPSTIRMVPLEPLLPGHRYDVTVDTGFSAFDGSRLAAAERFVLTVRGPTLIASKPSLHPTWRPALDPTGRVLLEFSAPVADSSLSNTVTLATQGGPRCAAVRTIAYRVERQRPLRSGDERDFGYLGRTDVAPESFRRIVELVPAEPVPEACDAILSVPSLDSLDARTVLYPVRTAPPFGRAGLGCNGDCPVAIGLSINFTAPVAADLLMRAVHFDPPAAFTPKEPVRPTASWAVAATLAPHTTYRVTVDSSLHDIYGRVMMFGFDTTFTTTDRLPDFGYATGLVYVPGHPAPVIRVRHVNVDSIVLLLIPVPERERVRALARAPRWFDDLHEAFRDSIVKVVPLHAPLNEERVSEVELPELNGPLFGRLIVLQTRLYSATRRPPEAPPASALVPPKRVPLKAFDQYYATPRTLLESTDLLAHVRLTSTGGVVWVTSARTGAPVRAAQVAVLDTSGASVANAATDSRGMATFVLPAGPARARALDVSFGRDRSITSLANASAADVSTASLEAATGAWSLPSGKATHAVLFADRGIYRPGESLHLGATIREGPLGNLVAPAGDSARLRISHWTSEGTRASLRDTIVTVSPFGTVAGSFRLSTETPLDAYYATVSLVRNGAWQDVGGTSLRVAEYRPSEFLVAATGDTALRIRGDTIVTRVSANYLFGAPMAGAHVEWSARFEQLRPENIRIPGLGREWSVGDAGAWWLPGRPVQAPPRHGSDTLDAGGAARLSIATDSVSFTRGSIVHVDVSVTDLNRQVVTTSTSSILHAASFYLAIRDSAASAYWQLGSPQNVKLEAVRADGRTLAGMPVRIAFVEARWKPTVSADPNDVSGTWHADTLSIDSLVTGESPRTIKIPALPEGPVQIIATAFDERGRPVRSTADRYVYGRSQVAGQPPMRLNVQVEHDHLAPGGEAVVRFASPWESADAWVSVEREGVMRERTLRGVHGLVTVKLPVTERDVPNVYVSVLLLRRDALSGANSPAERMRVGSAVLRVDDASKRLAVRLRALRQDYGPGDSAAIELTVRDARHRPVRAEATVWGVDEGVLALTGYSTPDQMRGLYAPIRDGVSFVSTLGSLPAGIPAWLWRRTTQHQFEYDDVNRLSQLVVTGAAEGAFEVRQVLPGGPATLAPRSLFLATAFFRNGVRTGADGTARITVKLPDNISTFRLMAVAAGAADQYGSADAPMLVTKPLVVRASLPRFIRAGDSVFAGAVINARDRVSRMIDVTASGRGVTLTGDDHARASLDATGGEVRFAWRGTAGDSARFRIGASDGTHSDAVSIAIPIKPDQTPRSRTVAGMIRDSATLQFRLPGDVDPLKSRLTVRTGTSPVPTLLVARDFLLASSYSCPEQLTSVGQMLVSLLTLERTGMRVLADTLWARRELQHVAADLARRYRTAGMVDCWGYAWGSSPVHAAANLLLLDIRDTGIPVDTAMVRRLATTFTHLLDTLPLLPDTTYGRRDQRRAMIANWLQSRLGAVAFLRRVSVPRERDLALLRENASRLTWEDRAWLADLLEQSGDHEHARELLDRLWGTLAMAGNRVEVPDSVLTTVGFPSHIRPVARLLEATLSIQPDHPRLGALVERLTSRTRAERDEWWNTQDHVAATVALSSFARTHRGRTGQLIVRLGRDTAAVDRPTFTLESGADEPRDTTVSLAGLTTAAGDSTMISIRLNVRGGAQYYAVTVAEVTRERPTAPDIKGLIVERWYERFDDGRTVTELREGDLVRVRMRITAPASRDFVAVEDMLPAGLETVDLTLRTSGTLGPFSTAATAEVAQRRNREAGGTPDSELYGSWYGGWWSPWGQPEQHDDRTVFFARKLWTGSFSLSYIARATTAGRFVRPQAHAEEVYNPAVNGRSEGGWFDVLPAIARRKP